MAVSQRGKLPAFVVRRSDHAAFDLRGIAWNRTAPDVLLDALIWATAKLNQIQTILSEDFQDGTRG